MASVFQKILPSTESLGTGGAGVLIAAAEKGRKDEKAGIDRADEDGDGDACVSVWYRCRALCFGLALQTRYSLPRLRTNRHDAHSLLMEDLTFIPPRWCDDGILVWAVL